MVSNCQRQQNAQRNDKRNGKTRGQVRPALNVKRAADKCSGHQNAGSEGHSQEHGQSKLGSDPSQHQPHEKKHDRQAGAQGRVPPPHQARVGLKLLVVAA